MYLRLIDAVSYLTNSLGQQTAGQNLPTLLEKELPGVKTITLVSLPSSIHANITGHANLVTLKMAELQHMSYKAVDISHRSLLLEGGLPRHFAFWFIENCVSLFRLLTSVVCDQPSHLFEA